MINMTLNIIDFQISSVVDISLEMCLQEQKRFGMPGISYKTCTVVPRSPKY